MTDLFRPVLFRMTVCANLLGSFRRASLLLLCVGALAVGGCDPKAECQESCSSDDECALGLVCHTMLNMGQVCVPESCNACFDQGKSCRWNTTETDTSSLTCEFTGCGF
jgi:hypothetical protein